MSLKIKLFKINKKQTLTKTTILNRRLIWIKDRDHFQGNTKAKVVQKNRAILLRLSITIKLGLTKGQILRTITIETIIIDLSHLFHQRHKPTLQGLWLDNMDYLEIRQLSKFDTHNPVQFIIWKCQKITIEFSMILYVN